MPSPASAAAQATKLPLKTLHGACLLLCGTWTSAYSLARRMCRAPRLYQAHGWAWGCRTGAPWPSPGGPGHAKLPRALVPGASRDDQPASLFSRVLLRPETDKHHRPLPISASMTRPETHSRKWPQGMEPGSLVPTLPEAFKDLDSLGHPRVPTAPHPPSSSIHAPQDASPAPRCCSLLSPCSRASVPSFSFL